MHLKMLSGKWWPFRLSLNVLSRETYEDFTLKNHKYNRTITICLHEIKKTDTKDEGEQKILVITYLMQSMVAKVR